MEYKCKLCKEKIFFQTKKKTQPILYGIKWVIDKDSYKLKTSIYEDNVQILLEELCSNLKINKGECQIYMSKNKEHQWKNLKFSKLVKVDTLFEHSNSIDILIKVVKAENTNQFTKHKIIPESVNKNIPKFKNKSILKNSNSPKNMTEKEISSKRNLIEALKSPNKEILILKENTNFIITHEIFLLINSFNSSDRKIFIVKRNSDILDKEISLINTFLCKPGMIYPYYLIPKHIDHRGNLEDMSIYKFPPIYVDVYNKFFSHKIFQTTKFNLAFLSKIVRRIQSSNVEGHLRFASIKINVEKEFNVKIDQVTIDFLTISFSNNESIKNLIQGARDGSFRVKTNNLHLKIKLDHKEILDLRSIFHLISLIEPVKNIYNLSLSIDAVVSIIERYEYDLPPHKLKYLKLKDNLYSFSQYFLISRFLSELAKNFLVEYLVEFIAENFRFDSPKTLFYFLFFLKLSKDLKSIIMKNNIIRLKANEIIEFFDISENGINIKNLDNELILSFNNLSTFILINTKLMKLSDLSLISSQVGKTIIIDNNSIITDKYPVNYVERVDNNLKLEINKDIFDYYFNGNIKVPYYVTDLKFSFLPIYFEENKYLNILGSIINQNHLHNLKVLNLNQCNVSSINLLHILYCNLSLKNLSWIKLKNIQKEEIDLGNFLKILSENHLVLNELSITDSFVADSNSLFDPRLVEIKHLKCNFLFLKEKEAIIEKTKVSNEKTNQSGIEKVSNEKTNQSVISYPPPSSRTSEFLMSLIISANIDRLSLKNNTIKYFCFETFVSNKTSNVSNLLLNDKIQIPKKKAIILDNINYENNLMKWLAKYFYCDHLVILRANTSIFDIKDVGDNYLYNFSKFHIDYYSIMNVIFNQFFYNSFAVYLSSFLQNTQQQQPQQSQQSQQPKKEEVEEKEKFISHFKKFKEFITILGKFGIEVCIYYYDKTQLNEINHLINMDFNLKDFDKIKTYLNFDVTKASVISVQEGPIENLFCELNKNLTFKKVKNKKEILKYFY